VADFELGERLEYWDGQGWQLAQRSFFDNVRLAVSGGWSKELTQVAAATAARVPQMTGE